MRLEDSDSEKDALLMTKQDSRRMPGIDQKSKSIKKGAKKS